jgi:hypothetical protein
MYKDLTTGAVSCITLSVGCSHPMLRASVARGRHDHYFSSLVTASERTALSRRYCLPGDKRNAPQGVTALRGAFFLSRPADTVTRGARLCNPFSHDGRGKPQRGSLLERAHGSGYLGDISKATRRVRKRNRRLRLTLALSQRNPQALSQERSTTLIRRAALERVTPGQLVLCPHQRGVLP